MRKIITLTLIGLALVLAAPLLHPHLAIADSVNDACQGIGLAGGNCGSSSANNQISKTFSVIVNIVSAVVGLAAVIMIIVGGFKYVTSGGDSSAVSGAKSTIIYAIVGLIVVALAQVIVHFVINKVGS